MHSIYCNQLFIETVSELGYPQEFDHLSDLDKVYVDDNVYKTFEPIDTAECAVDQCTEFNY
jgi:hypothetical protein